MGSGRLSRHKGWVESMSPSEFEVSLEGPIDFAASLAIFRRSGDDMIDRYDGTWLVRTTRVDRRAVAYACRLAGDVERPRLSVTVGNVRDRDAVEQAVRMIFLPMPREFVELCRVDQLVGRLAQLHRGFRPVMQSDLLERLTPQQMCPATNDRQGEADRGARAGGVRNFRERLVPAWVGSEHGSHKGAAY